MKVVLPLPNIILTKFTIQSCNGDDCKVDLDPAKKSVTIRTMLKDLGVEANNGDDEVKEVLPLPNIDSEVLRKVMIGVSITRMIQNLRRKRRARMERGNKNKL